MARTQLAVARSVQVSSSKHGSSNKKRRSGRARANAPGAGRAVEPLWSELEQAFFDAAPPDEAGPAEAPDCFDDLVAPAQPATGAAGLARAAAAAWTALRNMLTAPRPRPRAAAPR